MDQFDVPKTINRHVYKALMYLQSTKLAFPSEDAIGEQVKRQMRRNKKMVNMDEAIHQSLSNLTDLGILACTGSSCYAVRHTIRAAGDYVRQPKAVIKPKMSRRGIDRKSNGIKRRGRITKSKRISLMNFPKAETFVLCNECIIVLGKFKDTYKCKDFECCRSNVLPICAGANNYFPTQDDVTIISNYIEMEE